ncbi:MAG TPA: protein kinase [Candidatus Eisenbacteria bacterium]|nr:protein kinase [Candidatus Eisenbacteria bacterium]
MQLPSGARLGPYQILRPLGAGGMGEVYRALDPRLGREVAIKVLPQHLSAQPEVRARFEREAKTVSSLNHPNICTLFDVGREGDTDFLVMELVDGETLAERLGRGALPVGETLRIGAQIADALDRAHRAGVIHRDLKPGNIMLTKSGAKLMDFGLARADGLAGPAPGSGASPAALTQSPTVAQPLTAEGTIVGTFQYMAPEQLEGREADARTDIWALGCVLYEMATGRRAFEGRSHASLIAAILEREPAPASLLSPASPPALDRLIGRCLAKDPDDRWQTARDLMHELRAIPDATGGAAGAPVVRARASRGPTLPWAIAGAALLAALGLGAAWVTRTSGPREPVQLSLLPAERSVFTPYSSLIAISPDGRSIAYCAADPGSHQRLALYVQSLDSRTPVHLMDGETPLEPFWSPNGRELGVLSMGGRQLVTIPVSGGSPTVVCPSPGGRGGTWNRNGEIVFAPSASGPLYRVSASGGQPQQATWPDTARHEIGHRFPCFLPDGRHFLYVSLPRGPDGFPIYVAALDSHAARQITGADSAPTYAEPGYLLFRRAGKVMAQRFDARALKLAGAPVAIADAPPISDLDAEPVAAASRNGRLVMVDARAPDTQLEWLDPSGAPHGVLALPAAPWGPPRLSPDGRFAIVAKEGDLWSVDLQRSVATRITSSGLVRGDAVWSPDGRRIAFPEDHGREEIMMMNADGSGKAETVATTDDLFKLPEDWSSAGLVFQVIARQTLRDQWLLPTDGGKPVPLLQTPFPEYGGRVSPDGRWIAYLSTESGHDDVYVQSFPTLGHKLRVSTEGAQRVWWMPGSDGLWYARSDDNAVMRVTLTRRGDALVVGEPHAQRPSPPGLIGGDIARDGRRVLATIARASGSSSARVTLDWTALLRP